MKRLHFFWVLLLKILVIQGYGQSIGSPNKTLEARGGFKANQYLILPDTSFPITCNDTNRIAIVNGFTWITYKDPISGCAKWKIGGGGEGGGCTILGDTTIVCGVDTLRVKPLYIEKDLPPDYFFRDGDTIRDYTKLYIDDSVKVRKSGDTLFFPNGDTVYLGRVNAVGYAITGNGSSGNPLRVDSASLRGDYIRNQYAAREAKRLWVDSVRGNVVRFDTLITNNIGNQHIPIFVNGRMKGFANIQNNGVGIRLRQRNALEGFIPSDLVLTSTDTLGILRFSVRWDGATTIGIGTTANILDLYPTGTTIGSNIGRIKINSSTADARFTAENSGTGRISIQSISSGSSVLPGYTNLISENAVALGIISDYNQSSGGTSPIHLISGGRSVNPQLSIWPTNQIGINMSGVQPHSTLIYDVGGTQRATRPWSQLTTTQMNAISSPPAGSVVYNTTDSMPMIYDGMRWTANILKGTRANRPVSAAIGQRYMQTDEYPGWYVWDGNVWAYDVDNWEYSSGYIGTTGFGQNGANGGTLDQNSVSIPVGGYRVSTGNTSNAGRSQAIGFRTLIPAVGYVGVWNRVLTPSSLSNGTERYVIYSGSSFSGVTLPTRGGFFVYSDSLNSGNWVCMLTQTGSSYEVVNTSVPVTSSTYYDLVVLYTTSSARYYINGSLVATITTSIPTSFMEVGGFGIYKTQGTGNIDFFITRSRVKVYRPNN